MSLRYARLRDEELAARAAGESAYHLRANCSAEEQTRVMLLELQVPLENEKSRLEEQLLWAEQAHHRPLLLHGHRSTLHGRRWERVFWASYSGHWMSAAAFWWP